MVSFDHFDFRSVVNLWFAVFVGVYIATSELGDIESNEVDSVVEDKDEIHGAD
jgi:hypothetical protein